MCGLIPLLDLSLKALLDNIDGPGVINLKGMTVTNKGWSVKNKTSPVQMNNVLAIVRPSLPHFTTLLPFPQVFRVKVAALLMGAIIRGEDEGVIGPAIPAELAQAEGT